MRVQFDFVEFPTLRFLMGSNDKLGHPVDDESPPRHVTVGRLLVSRTPVTVAHFMSFVDDTGYETVAESEGSGFVGAYPDHQLQLGATWRRPTGPFGPPSELEDWVTQVAWTDAHAFCEWSGTRLLTEAQWARIGPYLGDQLSPEVGVNWEWCADYYDATFHRNEQRVNPAGPHHGTQRVARGGATRLTERAAFFPDLGAIDVTFRVCA